MKLSILIATVGWRTEAFLGLLYHLMPQVKTFAGKVEVIAYWNNGELPVGQIRKALVEQASGEYVCFIDDDDMVPDYYCKKILGALGKDYVGFRVKFFNDGVEMPPVTHSLRHTTWSQDEYGYYRGVTHLNPIKREIALRGEWPTSRQAGEDELWAKSVTPFVKTENYLDEVMYFYYHSKSDTSFGGDSKPRERYTRPVIKEKWFRYHPDSKEVS